MAHEPIELNTWVEIYEARNRINRELGCGPTKRIANHDPGSLVAVIRMLFADPAHSADTRPLYEHTERELAVARALIRLDSMLDVIARAPVVVGREKGTR